jgi:hypothetical protein
MFIFCYAGRWFLGWLACKILPAFQVIKGIIKRKNSK